MRKIKIFYTEHNFPKDVELFEKKVNEFLEEKYLKHSSVEFKIDEKRLYAFINYNGLGE